MYLSYLCAFMPFQVNQPNNELHTVATTCLYFGRRIGGIIHLNKSVLKKYYHLLECNRFVHLNLPIFLNSYIKFTQATKWASYVNHDFQTLSHFPLPHNTAELNPPFFSVFAPKTSKTTPNQVAKLVVTWSATEPNHCACIGLTVPVY